MTHRPGHDTTYRSYEVSETVYHILRPLARLEDFLLP
nr:MAG TPA: hypothetical protein [Caudoviricetes sp.]